MGDKRLQTKSSVGQKWYFGAKLELKYEKDEKTTEK